MTSDPVTSQERPEPPSASSPSEIKDQRAVEAAVAGVAGLLLGRAIFGRAGGLAAGLAAIGAGLLARRTKATAPQNGDAATSGNGAHAETEPQTVARFESPDPSPWEGWVQKARENTAHFFVPAGVEPAAAEAPGLPAAGESAEPPAPEALAPVAEAAPAPPIPPLSVDALDSAAGFSVISADAGDLPPVPELFAPEPLPRIQTAPVPVIQTAPVPPAETAAEIPASPTDLATGQESAIQPVSVLPRAAEIVDLAALVAAPLEADEPPAPSRTKPAFIEELPPEFAVLHEEPDPGPRGEFLVIPDQEPASPPPPLEPVVAALSAGISPGETETAAITAPPEPQFASEVFTLSSEPPPPPAPEIAPPPAVAAVTSDFDDELEFDDPVIPAPRVAPVSPEPSQRVEPPVEFIPTLAPVTAGSNPPAPAPAASPFMLWEPESGPVLQEPLAFPAVLPPAAAVESPVARPEPILRPEPLLRPEPISRPAPGPPQKAPDPDEIWRQAAAELATLKTTAVPALKAQPAPPPPVVLPPPFTAAAPQPQVLTPPAPGLPFPPPGPPSPIEGFPTIPPASLPSAPLPAWLQSAPAPPPLNPPATQPVVPPAVAPAVPAAVLPLLPDAPAPAPAEAAGEAKSFLRTIRLGVPTPGLKGSPLMPPPGFDPALAAVPAIPSLPVPLTPAGAPLTPLNAPPIAPAPGAPPVLPFQPPAAAVSPAAPFGPPQPLSGAAPVPGNALPAATPVVLSPPAAIPSAAALPAMPAAPAPAKAQDEKVFIPSRKAPPRKPEASKPLITPGRLLLVALLAAAGLGITFKQEIRTIWQEQVMGRQPRKPSDAAPAATPADGSSVIIKAEAPRPAPPLTLPSPGTEKPAPLPPAPPAEGTPAPATPPTPPASAAQPPAPKTATPLPATEVGARELIVRLLKGKSPGDISPFIHDSARLTPSLPEYFSSGRALPVTIYTLNFERADALPSTGRTAWQFLVTTDKMQSAFPVTVEDTADGLRADWELFTQCRDDRFAKWHDNAAAPAALFYSVIRRAHIFPDMLPEEEKANYLAFELRPPLKDFDPIKAYIHKSSPIFTRAEDLYVWESSYTPLLELTHKDGRVHITGIIKENWRPIMPRRK